MMTDGQGNSGNCNSGNFNSGNRNSGNFNSGNRNSGNFNSGNRNSGNCNSGNFNSGFSNSGDFNSGNCNSGNFNSGFSNSGDFNSGNCNSGDFNSGYYNSGFFCTETAKPRFFDRDTNLTWDDAIERIPHIDLPVSCEWVFSDDMTDEEKAEYPSHTITGGFLRIQKQQLREVFPIAWKKMSHEERQRWLGLPNFDAEKFLKITGVDVCPEGLPDEVTIDGVVYVRKQD